MDRKHAAVELLINERPVPADRSYLLILDVPPKHRKFLADDMA
jgi:hypothetical protein